MSSKNKEVDKEEGSANLAIAVTAAPTANAEQSLKQRFIAEYNSNRQKQPGVEHVDCSEPQSILTISGGPLAKSDVSKQSKVHLETEQDDDEPNSPFNSLEVDDSIQKKIQNSANNGKGSIMSSEHSRVKLSRIEQIVVTNTQLLRVLPNELEMPLPPSSDLGDSINTGGYIKQTSNVSSVEQQAQEVSIIIPEAVLVDEEAKGQHDDIVISGYAQPVIPFWKQTSTRVFLCVIIMLIVAFASTLVVLFTSGNADNGADGSNGGGKSTGLSLESDVMEYGVITSEVPTVSPVPAPVDPSTTPETTVETIPETPTPEMPTPEGETYDAEADHDYHDEHDDHDYQDHADDETATATATDHDEVLEEPTPIDSPIYSSESTYDPGPDIGIILLITFGSLLFAACVSFCIFAKKKRIPMQPRVGNSIADCV